MKRACGMAVALITCGVLAVMPACSSLGHHEPPSRVVTVLERGCAPRAELAADHGIGGISRHAGEYQEGSAYSISLYGGHAWGFLLGVGIGLAVLLIGGLVKFLAEAAAECVLDQ